MCSQSISEGIRLRSKQSSPKRSWRRAGCWALRAYILIIDLWVSWSESCSCATCVPSSKRTNIWRFLAFRWKFKIQQSKLGRAPRRNWNIQHLSTKASLAVNFNCAGLSLLAVAVLRSVVLLFWIYYHLLTLGKNSIILIIDHDGGGGASAPLREK